jgi:hypothetical protein
MHRANRRHGPRGRGGWTLGRGEAGWAFDHAVCDQTAHDVGNLLLGKAADGAELAKGQRPVDAGEDVAFVGGEAKPTHVYRARLDRLQVPYFRGQTHHPLA